jgi:hypothetical protein
MMENEALKKAIDEGDLDAFLSILKEAGFPWDFATGNRKVTKTWGREIIAEFIFHVGSGRREPIPRTHRSSGIFPLIDNKKLRTYFIKQGIIK